MGEIAYYEGISDMYAAEMLKEETPTTPPEYGPVQLLGIGVSYKIAPKYTEGTLPGGNRNLREKKRLTGYEVELEVDRIRGAVLETMSGNVRDANGVTQVGRRDAPFMALLFAVPLDDGTKELWALYKGKIAAPDSEVKTRDGGKYEWKTPTAKGSFGLRNDIELPAATCETGDENVSEAVKAAWFDHVYTPSNLYGITAVLQPDDLALTAGEIAGDTLVFVARGTDGGTPTYQWYRNTTAIATGGTAVSGATAAAYAIPANTSAGTYYYYCVATYQGKTVTSDVAKVTVNA